MNTKFNQRRQEKEPTPNPSQEGNWRQEAKSCRGVAFGRTNFPQKPKSTNPNATPSPLSQNIYLRNSIQKLPLTDGYLKPSLLMTLPCGFLLASVLGILPAAQAEELGIKNEELRIKNEELGIENGEETSASSTNAVQELETQPVEISNNSELLDNQPISAPVNTTQDLEIQPVGISNGSELLNNQPTAPSTNTQKLEIQPVGQSQNLEQFEELPNSLPTTSDQAQLAPNQVRILAPQTGATIDTLSDSGGVRTTNLIVQYSADSQVQVRVNEKLIASNIVTQIERDESQNLITQVWYNIPLETGENIITVAAENGSPATVQLTVEEQSAQIEIAPLGNPRIPADSRSFVDIEGTITDENGELITEDTVVTLTASAGEFAGADHEEDQTGFQVLAKEGKFTARLRSSLEAQKVRIRAAVVGLGVGHHERETASSYVPLSSELPQKELEAYTQVEFTTNLRPSIMSGVLNLRVGKEGTDYFGSRRDFIPLNGEEDAEVNFQGSVFATGAVGEWLFTGAYNSFRPLNENCEGITELFSSPQACEQKYSVYGDSSTTEYLTPSTDSVYLRFERNSPVPGAEPDYVMWGDYRTTELARASQEFSATTRALHGFKGNFNFGNLQLTGVFSNDVQGFQRDTIAPDGTSGYYFLSRRLLVHGSENVFIETEEINRPGTVISREPLFRGPDYEINYDRGTLLFRRPIHSVDIDPFGETLVRRIVVTYQFEGVDTDETNIYGGRAQYNFSQEFGQESWLAATYLQEDEGDRDFELYAADFFVPFGDNLSLVGEYAYSENNSEFSGTITGSAYRIELDGNITPNIRTKAYYRLVEENFVNNATFSYAPGQNRYGASVAAAVTPTTNIQVGYDYERNFGRAPAVRTTFEDLFSTRVEAEPGSRVDNELTTIRAGVGQKIGAADLSLEYVNRSREDGVGDTFDSNTSQIVSRLNLPILDTLDFRAQNELSLDDNDPLYPNRTTLGLDWQVEPGVSLQLAHQFFNGGLLGENSITSLGTSSDHRFGDSTTLTNRYQLVNGHNGLVGQSTVGLNHQVVLSPGLRLNLGYEHVGNSIDSQTAVGQRFAQPYAVGQGASALSVGDGDSYNVGLEYTASPDFRASARFERRGGSVNGNTVISAAASGKLTPALTALVRFNRAGAANQLLEELDDTTSLKLGMAYRNPVDDTFNALLNYEYRDNPSTIPDTLLLGSGTGSEDHVLSFEGILAPSWRWEFYSKFAMRHSKTDLAQNFSNSSAVYLGQMRASYRLGYRMDLAVEGRTIQQPSANFTEWGWAVETGFYVTPDLRVGVGYSFGSVDDRDFSGYRASDGPYLNISVKVNDLFGFGRQRPVLPDEEVAGGVEEE
ncbi:MAG: TonB-dependent receptor [Symploca sp. SIO2D2]|nr:TonB-dependent receptor [Symploca sp. SIO2D2]